MERTKRLTTIVSAQEELRIRNLAWKAKKTVSRYLRDQALNGVRKEGKK